MEGGGGWASTSLTSFNVLLSDALVPLGKSKCVHKGNQRNIKCINPSYAEHTASNPSFNAMEKDCSDSTEGAKQNGFVLILNLLGRCVMIVILY